MCVPAGYIRYIRPWLLSVVRKKTIRSNSALVSEEGFRSILQKHMPRNNDMKRVVPWANREEFESVYQDIFSKDITRQEYAVGRCLVWKSRVSHKLPVAIESTTSLCSACISHQRAAARHELNQCVQAVSSEYCLALIRFVNHITEKGQNKAISQPVHIIAAEFGVPEWIVDLRHDATHGQMPALAMLRAGAEWALEWLKSEFWEDQLRSMEENEEGRKSSVHVPTISEEEVCKALDEYMQEKKEAMSKVNSSNSMKIKALDRVEKGMLQNRLMTIRCLLSKNYLLCHGVVPHALDSTIDLNENSPLPQGVLDFWKPLLRSLERLKSLELLLLEMVAMVTDEHSTRNSLLIKWIKAIITCNNGEDERFKRLFKTRQSLPYSKMFEDCIKVPNRNTANLIKFLLPYQRPGLPDSTVTQTLNLTDIYLGTCNHSGAGSPLPDCRSVNDLPTEGRKSTSDDNTINGSSWKLCTAAVDWSACPIGVLPGQLLTYNLDADRQNQDSVYTPLIAMDMSQMHSSQDEEEACGVSTNWMQNDIEKIKSLLKLF